MHTSNLIVLAVVVAASYARASEDFPPARTRNGEVLFIANHGKLNKLLIGLNSLDKPRQFQCKSTYGCLVSFSAEITTTETLIFGICGFVDSKSAKPKCSSWGNYGNLDTTTSRQVTKVEFGLHAIYTDLNSAQEASRGIGEWETDYTIYELRAPSKDD